MKVKAQILQYEKRKLKGGMRGSKLSTRWFIPWFGLPQRRPYIHVIEALTKSITFRQSSLFFNTITVTLIPLSINKLVHKRWGLHIPRTKLSTPLRTEPLHTNHRQYVLTYIPRAVLRASLTLFWFCIIEKHKSKQRSRPLCQAIS